MKRYFPHLGRFAWFGLTAIAIIALTMFFIDRVSPNKNIFLIEATAHEFSYVVRKSQTSVMYLSGYRVSPDLPSVGKCFEGKFEPAPDATVTFSQVGGFARITVDRAKTATSDNAILLGELNEVPVAPDIEQIEFLGNCSSCDADCAGLPENRRTYFLIDGQLTIAQVPIVSQWDLGSRPNLLKGSVKIYGRTFYNVGPVSFGWLGFRRSLFAALDDPIDLPPGVRVTPLSPRSSAEPNVAPMYGYAELVDGNYNISASANAERLQIDYPLAGGNLEQEFLTVNTIDRAAHDPGLVAVAALIGLLFAGIGQQLFHTFLPGERPRPTGGDPAGSTQDVPITVASEAERPAAAPAATVTEGEAADETRPPHSTA